ncbi:hypothetical protein [Achromobacter insolitus]|uniref:hypothetical protein n=1 Tax=Achromobacter insolitus TaxID=217204 RepID=UPI000A869A9A|nr:hypothetical protein [Achromobacter insolitus]
MHKGYQVLLLLLWLGFCAVLFNNWPKDSAQWASWVQAIGSIAAIVAAVLVGRHQAGVSMRVNTLTLNANEDRAASDAYTQLLGAQTLLRRTVEMIVRADQEIPLKRTPELRAHSAERRLLPLRVGIEALEMIPIHELPYALVSEPALSILNRANLTSDVLQRMARNNLDDPKAANIQHSLQTELSRLAAKAKLFMRRFEDEVSQYKPRRRV